MCAINESYLVVFENQDALNLFYQVTIIIKGSMLLFEKNAKDEWEFNNKPFNIPINLNINGNVVTSVDHNDIEIPDFVILPTDKNIYVIKETLEKFIDVILLPTPENNEKRSGKVEYYFFISNSISIHVNTQTQNFLTETADPVKQPIKLFNEQTAYKVNNNAFLSTIYSIINNYSFLALWRQMGYPADAEEISKKIKTIMKNNVDFLIPDPEIQKLTTEMENLSKTSQLWEFAMKPIEDFSSFIREYYFEVNNNKN